MNSLSRFSLVMASAAVLLVNGVAVACPTCKDALASGNSSNLVDGFGWSIIFMMSMPFLIFGGISAYFYYEVRKARRASAPAAATYPSVTQVAAS